MSIKMITLSIAVVGVVLLSALFYSKSSRMHPSSIDSPTDEYPQTF